MLIDSSVVVQGIEASWVGAPYRDFVNDMAGVHVAKPIKCLKSQA